MSPTTIVGIGFILAFFSIWRRKDWSVAARVMLIAVALLAWWLVSVFPTLLYFVAGAMFVLIVVNTMIQTKPDPTDGNAPQHGGDNHWDIKNRENQKD